MLVILYVLLLTLPVSVATLLAAGVGSATVLTITLVSLAGLIALLVIKKHKRTCELNTRINK